MGMSLPEPNPGSPLGWRRFGKVSLGEHLLGEEAIHLQTLGFTGKVVEIDCPHCNSILGRVPVELLGEELEDITFAYILPVVEWHLSRCSDH